MDSTENKVNPGSNTLSTLERGLKNSSSSPQISGFWLKSQSMLVGILKGPLLIRILSPL